MAVTKITYSANGSQTQFAIPFEYIAEADVDVYIDTVLQLKQNTTSTAAADHPQVVSGEITQGTALINYTFANATTIEFNSAPTSGAFVFIQRTTDDSSVVTFTSGSTIRASELNTALEQVRFIAQEGTNTAQEGVVPSKNNSGSIDAQGKRLENLANANSDDDAVNRSQLGRVITDDLVAGNAITLTDATGGTNSNKQVTVAVTDGAIDTAELADSAVTTAKIADANVTEAKIANANVTTSKIADSNVTTAKLADSSVTTAKVADSNVTTSKIADSNVTTSKIADANVTTAKIANSNVTTDKIADANVTTAKLAADAVTSAKLADNAVGNEHLQNDSVNTNEISDSAVTTAKIATSSVTTAKIADANVTEAKIADSAVTSAKIADGTILNADINASAAIAGSKLADDSVDLDKISNSDVVEASSYNSTWDADDTKIATVGALAARHDVSVGTSLPTTNQTGKLFLDVSVGNQSFKAYDGSGWRTVAVGQPYTPATNTITRYVDVTNGSDSAGVTGFLPQAPLRSIKRAVELINASSDGDGSLIKVAPGVYQETLPIRIKKNNVSIVGESLRSCFVHPTVATENNDMFEVTSGSYISNLTMCGIKVPTGSQGTRNNPIDSNSTYGLPSNQPFAIRFRTDISPVILKSPYIQNCTHFSDAHFDNANFDPNTFPSTDSQTFSAVAGDESSAPCGGGLLVDGAAVSSSSPIRSMVVDAFTQITLDGPGILVTNNGYAQLVSFFGTFCHYHAKALNGGQLNVSNCVTDFGRYGLIADGKSPSPIASATASAANSGATTVTIGAITTDSGFHGTVARPLDHMMVTIDGVDYGVKSSSANGAGWDIELVSPLTSNITNTTVNFALRSYISTGGHTFEYVGVGTNYGDHPDQGGVPIEANTVVELNGGKVWQSSTSQIGKFKAGEVLVVDQVNETVDLKATTVTGNLAVTGTVDGRDVAADGTKLDGIETGATADQTAAEIRTLVESASDSNVFTDADHTKLNGIESGATADQTASEIRTLVESASDSNVFTDADHTKLNGIEAQADVTDAFNVNAAGAVMNGDTTIAAMQFVVDEDNMASDLATKVPTQQSVKAYVDAQVAGVVDSAPQTLDTLNELAAALGDDQNFSTTVSNSIGTKLSLAGGTMTGNIVMSGAQTVDGRDLSVDGQKLDGIAAGAEVNVQSDWNATSGDAQILNKPTIPAAQVQSDWNATSGVSQILNKPTIPSGDLVNDTTPQLGGDLDMNSKFISSGIVGIKNQGSQSEVRLYCEASNAHYASIKAPPHSGFSGNVTFTMPGTAGSNGQVLKTDGNGNLSWVSQTSGYSNTDVNAHLNTSSATSNQVLSWTGTDYDWVNQSSGGSGGISNVVEDTTPQLGGNLDMQSNNISGTGTIIANSTASTTAGMRKITTSTSNPSGGSDGDVWIKYTP